MLCVSNRYNYLGEEMDSFGLVLKNIVNMCIYVCLCTYIPGGGRQI